jgi:hypothetical protein
VGRGVRAASSSSFSIVLEELRARGRYAKKGTYMAKSSERDKAEGALYKVGAGYYRVLVP